MLVIAVFDNGKENLDGLADLLKEVGTYTIFISPYNSKANGIIENGHSSITGALKKTELGSKSRWLPNLERALLADRSAVRAS
ncbi:hypothetical protein BGZ61DRAFT_376806, partial [Ilyonectria robusta]|uniref:uncharacterized protein n=1 Tax=Ilyonectria robusta TaxID=1079257 RepID=UPI001E8E26F7